MQSPRIELIPARSAVCQDAATSLEVLVRITPPLADIHIVRPPINMAIVLDRSGSMSHGGKMEYARQAAIFAISQMLPTDRVSVTIFDEVIETIVPSALVNDKAGLAAKLRQVHPRGSTALHGGWAAGAQQVLEHLTWQGLNRVLLLSDGLANVGLSDPEAIGAEVRGMAAREVSTSTIGVGADFNEDLMSAMAEAGAGNYYFVDNPVQLADLFQTELQGLMGTTGRNAELMVEPGPGVAVAEVLTGLKLGASGQILLPDLVSDMPISVLIRLSVAAAGGPQLARFVLTWQPTGDPDAGRQEHAADLALPTVPAQEWNQLPIDPTVQEQLVLILSAKAREELHAALGRRDAAASQTIIDQIKSLLATVPETHELREELENLKRTEEYLIQGLLGSSRKMSHYMGHYRTHGRSSPPRTS